MKRYRLYIDESGDHTFGNLEDIGRQYLCLLGIFIDQEIYRSSFHPSFEKLKQNHFPHNPDEPLILHRSDIINKRGAFGRLVDPDKEQVFNADLLNFFAREDYMIIGVVIDKKSHIRRYGSAAYHPYHYCLAALLERYCGFLNFYNSHGDVLAESRGGVEDTKLKEAYRLLHSAGTQFRGAQFFQKVLTSSEIKLKPKSSNIAGLQVADLLAYPVKQKILMENKVIRSLDDFNKEICAVVHSKYNRHAYDGRISGYGWIFIS